MIVMKKVLQDANPPDAQKPEKRGVAGDIASSLRV